ncbi:MAG: MoaD family protein [Planctomycetota bacterium]
MINVTVKYLAGFSATVGKIKENIRLPDHATLSTLTETIKKRYRKKFSSLLTTDKSYRNVIFLRNGILIDEKTILEHGDEIIISLPVGGG